MNEITVVEKPEIQVIELEPSDVLRQKRLEKQLSEKELYDELIFRRVMICIGMLISGSIGFIAGEIVAASILL